MRLILYHGTSEDNAKKIEKEGFVTDKSYNWDIKSKPGFLYLSQAYGPFYAMSHNTNKLALIKVEVDSKDCYPEDDFLMWYMLKKPKYTQDDLDKINLENHKFLWRESLKYIGNVAVKPDKVKVLGIRYFDGKNLLFKCDPSITPINFKIMGEYYKQLSEWIYGGNDILKFKNIMGVNE